LPLDETGIQIRIAEIQADIQISITLSAGFVATAIAALAIIVGFYPTLRIQNDLLNILVAFLTVVLELICLYYGNESIKRTKSARNELRKLKETYVW